ncbi:MAG: hypothetical protein AAGF54_01515, partial [Pseudomonadota bacterium]
MSRIDETRPFIPVSIAVLTVSDTRSLECAVETAIPTANMKILKKGPPPLIYKCRRRQPQQNVILISSVCA